jgi:hypothetical protein
MNQYRFFIGCILISLLTLMYSPVIAQTGIQCVACGGMNGNHKTTCKYYNPPAKSNSNSSKVNVGQMFMGALLNRMLNPVPSSSTLTEQEKLRLHQDDVDPFDKDRLSEKLC